MKKLQYALLVIMVLTGFFFGLDFLVQYIALPGAKNFLLASFVISTTFFILIWLMEEINSNKKELELNEKLESSHAHEVEYLMKMASIQSVDEYLFKKGILQKLQHRLAKIAPLELGDFQKLLAGKIFRHAKWIQETDQHFPFTSIKKFFEELGIAETNYDLVDHISTQLQDIVVVTSKDVVFKAAEKEFDFAGRHVQSHNPYDLIDTAANLEIFKRMGVYAHLKKMTQKIETTIKA